MRRLAPWVAGAGFVAALEGLGIIVAGLLIAGLLALLGRRERKPPTFLPGSPDMRV